MGEKDDKTQKENERRKDESTRRYKRDEDSKENKRDITKVQAPDKWPDPPKEKDDN